MNNFPTSFKKVIISAIITISTQTIYASDPESTRKAHLVPGEGIGVALAMLSGNVFENLRHVERFYLNTSTMSASPNPWDLGGSNQQLDMEQTINFIDKPMSIKDFLAYSGTSSFIVLKEGQIIHESYYHGDSRESVHASFSMAKTFTSAMVGFALADGKIDSLDDPIRQYLPQLTSPTFDGVTIRNVLNMSSGIRFNEKWTDRNSDIHRMAENVPPMSYLEFANTLGRAYPPGTFHQYVSLNSHLLSILVITVAGESLTSYMERSLWHPLGMEQKGLWGLDAQGYEVGLGWLAASARDYAKFGLLYLNNGRRGDQQILPEAWIKESTTLDQPHLMPGDNPQSSSKMGYKFQWWMPEDWDGDYCALGHTGQYICVNPKNNVVIVKLSGDKQYENYKPDYVKYLTQLGKSLTSE